jgi:hypothetical protein
MPQDYNDKTFIVKTTHADQPQADGEYWLSYDEIKERYNWIDQILPHPNGFFLFVLVRDLVKTEISWY